MIKRVTGVAVAVAVAITMTLTAVSCDAPADDCDSMGTGIELAGFKPRPVSKVKPRSLSRSHRSSGHRSTHHHHHSSHHSSWDDDCD